MSSISSPPYTVTTEVTPGIDGASNSKLISSTTTISSSPGAPGPVYSFVVTTTVRCDQYGNLSTSTSVSPAAALPPVNVFSKSASTPRTTLRPSTPDCVVIGPTPPPKNEGRRANGSVSFPAPAGASRAVPGCLGSPGNLNGNLGATNGTLGALPGSSDSGQSSTGAAPSSISGPFSPPACDPPSSRSTPTPSPKTPPQFFRPSPLPAPAPAAGDRPRSRSKSLADRPLILKADIRCRNLIATFEVESSQRVGVGVDLIREVAQKYLGHIPEEYSWEGFLYRGYEDAGATMPTRRGLMRKGDVVCDYGAVVVGVFYKEGEYKWWNPKPRIERF